MSIGGIKDSTDASSRMATFVIGVEPKDSWIAVFPGVTDQSGIDFSDTSRAAYYGPSKDGYVIGQVESERPLGVMQVRLVSKPGGFVGTNYEACGGGKTLVFVPKVGSVSYVGHVRYGSGQDVLEAAYSDKFDEAKAFLNRSFPKLASALDRSSRQVLPVIDMCRQAAYPFPQ